MSRKKIHKKQQKTPDIVYKSKVITKLINMIMKDGKKSLAEKIVYNVVDNLHEDKKEARKLFEDAVKNVMPDVEVRSKRIVGANYQIPVPVKYDRAETLALRWLIQAGRSKKGAPMENKLLEEIKLAYQKEGAAMKKRADMHKMADANKAFAFFKW